ncbi:MAG: aminotransferase class III-fold pyridoxal phosphate-dependent enzyme [Sulfitobacter sp.]
MAITNGYFPFGAVMVPDAFADVFEQDGTGGGFIGSRYTLSGRPVGAAAAIVRPKEAERLQIKDNAAARGKQLFAGVQALMDRFETIGDVSGGRSLICDAEPISNRKAKTPLEKKLIRRIHQGAYEAGVMLRVFGNNIILSPPLVVSEANVDTILNALAIGPEDIS